MRRAPHSHFELGRRRAIPAPYNADCLELDRTIKPGGAQTVQVDDTVATCFVCRRAAIKLRIALESGGLYVSCAHSTHGTCSMSSGSASLLHRGGSAGCNRWSHGLKTPNALPGLASFRQVTCTQGSIGAIAHVAGCARSAGRLWAVCRGLMHGKALRAVQAYVRYVDVLVKRVGGPALRCFTVMVMGAAGLGGWHRGRAALLCRRHECVRCARVRHEMVYVCRAGRPHVAVSRMPGGSDVCLCHWKELERARGRRPTSAQTEGVTCSFPLLSRCRLSFHQQSACRNAMQVTAST